jgi:hypothetical protein
MTKVIYLGLLLVVALATAIWLTLDPQARAAVEPYLHRAGEIVLPMRTAIRSMRESIRPTTDALSDLVAALLGLGEGLRSLWASIVASVTPSR